MVEGDLTSVTQFTVVADGREWVFRPDPDGTFAFPLPHLREHLRDGTPVRVTYVRIADASLQATEITDG